MQVQASSDQISYKRLFLETDLVTMGAKFRYDNCLVIMFFLVTRKLELCHFKTFFVLHLGGSVPCLKVRFQDTLNFFMY